MYIPRTVWTSICISKLENVFIFIPKVMKLNKKIWLFCWHQSYVLYNVHAFFATIICVISDFCLCLHIHYYSNIYTLLIDLRLTERKIRAKNSINIWENKNWFNKNKKGGFFRFLFFTSQHFNFIEAKKEDFHLLFWEECNKKLLSAFFAYITVKTNNFCKKYYLASNNFTKYCMVTSSDDLC